MVISDSENHSKKLPKSNHSKARFIFRILDSKIINQRKSYGNFVFIRVHFDFFGFKIVFTACNIVFTFWTLS